MIENSTTSKRVAEKLTKLQQESRNVLTEVSLNMKNVYISEIMNILHQLKNEINNVLYSRLLNNAIDGLANPSKNNLLVVQSLSELTGDESVDRKSALNY